MKSVYLIAAAAGLNFLYFQPVLTNPRTVALAPVPEVKPIPKNEKAVDIECDTKDPAPHCFDKMAGGATKRFVVNARRTQPEKPEIAGAKKDAGEAGQVFQVTSAKTLRIRFLGYKELTGEYSVNADATVSIPVLGRISVAGLDAAALEKILTKRVTALTGRKGYATVEIADYRPIFVTGIVKDSRSFAWTPRMTILHAITLAGGTSRLAVGGLNLGFSTNTQMARIEQASNKLKRSLATLTRLRAERRSSSEIKVPARLIEVAGSSEAEKLIQAQTEVLLTNNNSYTNETNAINQAIKTAKTELKGMKRQVQLIKRQLKLGQQHQKELRRLAKRKLLSKTTFLDRETRLAQTEERNINTLVAQARLNGRLLDLKRDLLVVKQKREGALDRQIFALERGIAGQEIELKAAKNAIRALTNGAGMPGINGRKKNAAFKIVRESKSGASTIIANQFTRIQPGDIIVVSR